MSVRLRILGPLELWSGDARVTFAGVAQQKVLAALALGRGSTVQVSRIVEALWEDEPPATAAQQVHKHIHALRQVLGDVIVTETPGYRLALRDDSVDAWQFSALVAQARAWRRAGQAKQAADELLAALSLWRGPALGDLNDALRADSAALDEERLRAQEEWFDLEISLGRHAEVVSSLAALVEQHPSRERLAGHLMLAQYRCGMRDEALDTYQRLDANPSERLRTLHHAILRRHPALSRSGWSTPLPACLPIDLPTFVGRAGELSTLDEIVDSPLSIATITGTAGVGKTATAVRWAHQARHHFPDGQLHVDLRGHDPAPSLSPSEALSLLLRALGTPPEQIPDGLDERAGLYRSTTDERRILVLLDNAGSADQVIPLLPGTSGCFVVITSRNALIGLGVQYDVGRVDLDVLPDGEALALLRGVLGEDRVEAERAEATQLLELCGNLPLALRIAAANLANRSSGTIAGLVHDLRHGDRLMDVDGEPRSGLRAAFDLSFAAVDEQARRLLCLLGTSPLVDVDTTSAAALLGVSRRAADLVLATLETAHLAQEHLPGRHRLHDLIKVYASEQDVTGVAEAAGRLAEHFVVRVDAALDELASSMQRETRPEGFTAVAAEVDPASWLVAEQANLVAAFNWALDHGEHLVALHLADALRPVCWLHRLMDDWVAIGHRGLKAAEEHGDPRLVAAMHRSLGLVYFYLGDGDRSVTHNVAALELCERLGDVAGAITVHINVSNVYNGDGRFAESLSHLERALALADEANQPRLEVLARLNMAAARYYQGELQLAAEATTKAVEVAEQLDDPYLTARTHLKCATMFGRMGFLPQAESHHAVGRRLNEEIGNEGGELDALVWQANQRLAVGDLASAEKLTSAAFPLISRKDHVNEINTLVACARVQCALERTDRALDLCEQGLLRARETNTRWAEIEALTVRAEILLARNEIAAATRSAQTAVELADGSGYKLFKGDAHHVVARTKLAQDDADGAAAHLRHALEWHRRCGQRLREAADLVLLGDSSAAEQICTEVAQEWAPDVLRQLSRK